MRSEFKDYGDFKEKYWLEGVQIGMFFEGIGVLLHRKLIDIGLVADLLPVETAWEKMKLMVEGDRQKFNAPRFYEYFENLYNEVQTREQQLARI